MSREYKNYINHYRRTNKIESLRTILNYNKKFNLSNLNSKYELEYVDGFRVGSKNYYSLRNNLHIFQLMPIIREVLINAGNVDLKPLKNYKNFSDAINKSRTFTEGLESNNGKSKDELYKILWILGHEQFHLQKLNNSILDFINFFYDIYSDEILNENIKSKFNIDVLEIFSVSIGIFLINNFSTNLFIDLKHNDTYKTFDKDIIDNYILKFTKNIDDFTSLLKVEEPYYLDSSSFKNHGLKELYKYPIFEFDGKFLSPIPQLIINRVTNFLYFDIIEGNKLGDELGLANERCIYKILENINVGNLVNIDIEYLSYKKYRIDKKKIIDFVINYNNNFLLFECKTNCLELKSKREGILDKDKKRIVDALFQLYYTIDVILKEKSYIGFEKIDITNIKILPILTYIFPPYMNFGNVRKEIIDLLVIELESNGINGDIVKAYPFITIDNVTLNSLVHILNNVGLEKFIDDIISKGPNSSENDILVNEFYNIYNIDYEIPFYNKMKVIDEVLEKIKL